MYVEDTDETVARRIGVQPDVLVEARALKAARLRDEQDPEYRGQEREHLRGQSRARFFVHVAPPPEIYLEWVAARDQRQLPGTTLLRSIIHLVLQQPSQPAWITHTTRKKGGGWPFRGEWYVHKNIRSRDCRVATELSPAAHKALCLRAENTRASATAIVRWGVCLFISGQLTALPIVPTVKGLYRDPEQYCLRPKVI